VDYARYLRHIEHERYSGSWLLELAGLYYRLQY
jgi:hypothetical protein